MATGDVLQIGESGDQEFAAPAVPASFFKASRLVTSAEILDLANTPIEIAPGIANRFLVPVGVTAFWNNVTTPYDLASHPLTIGPTAAALFQTIALFELDGSVIEAAGDLWLVGKPTAVTGSWETSGIGLALFVDGAFSGGDGTLFVTVWYGEAASA